MSDPDDIRRRFLDIVAYLWFVSADDLTNETAFTGALTNETDLVTDSMDMVELMIACEDEFQVSISDEEAEEIRTIGQAVGFLLSKGAT